jgi:uncharacterized membrane protein
VRKNLTLKDTLPWILIIGGIIGVLCAGILTTEKIELLKNPHAQLICNINPIVACGSVINTWQASAFGFSNVLIGLAGFGGVASIGGGLLAGAKYKRWYWLGLQTGVTFAVGFVTWLQYQTIFRIHALCPFCMVVWSVTIPIFIYTTIYNLSEGNIKLGKKHKTVSAFIRRHHADILVSWYLIIFLVILVHFWYYWKTII